MYSCLLFSPPDETDGPPGAIAMATMLLSLGKQVTLLTDGRAAEMNQALVDEAVRTGKAQIGWLGLKRRTLNVIP